MNPEKLLKRRADARPCGGAPLNANVRHRNRVAMTGSLLTVGLWLLTSGAFAAQELTEKNWLNHPDIVEVRSVYQKVNDDKNAGKLKKKERKFKYCEPYEDTVRTLYTARDGTPRIYSYGGGSDDSSVQHELYYDESGKLRFAFIIAGAYNGTKLEHRVYLSKAGKKIWETQKRLEGPGYTFPTEWPDEELIRNPLQAFNDKSPCPETK